MAGEFFLSNCSGSDGRLSGPLLDRIDLHVEVPAVKFRDMTSERVGETSAQIRARVYDRILKVARTIADLNGAEQIDSDHVAEAVQFRSLDRQWWT